ncbi:hypothetical protein [Niallia endozanthoxylica]|uniref:DUF4367 domain-containing protein n=1 Tax=Niallia endozanthoxylica TaxID=2036016 RepID=A0A5J5HS54_9BACI|nr:hypothetical protein [Niallia endozanthoxylica]KAA9022885.1 hypothetical protein F4V44_14165 [Niallia endozanthoxylica]
MNNIKQELEKIEIPKELNYRVALGIKQANMEEKRKKRYSKKWILGSVASMMIIGTGFAFAGSHIVDATSSLINQLFGSKEELIQSLPDEPKESLNSFEQHLAFAEQYLSEEEFATYSQLIKEQIKIVSNIQTENRKPNIEEEQRLEELSAAIEIYDAKLNTFTTHTIDEAQQMIDYPITKPTFIPEGYKQVSEEIHTDESHVGKDPIVELKYSKGEFGFWITQQKIDKNQKDELEKRNFEHTESYSLKEFEFEYVYSEDTNVTGMRVFVREKGYKMTMIADILTKEEMEEILLSMVEK